MEAIIKGVKVNYEISGQGENMLVLHGWGGCIDSMRPVINHLADRYRVISLDFPGHGKSGQPSQPWGVPEYTDFLIEFLKVNNIESTNIIAHSFGGRVTILLSAGNPQIAKKIVLIDSGGIKPRRSLKYFIRVYTYKALKRCLKIVLFNDKTYQSVMEKFRKKLGSSDYSKLSGVMKETFIKIVNQDLTPYLKDIKSPTLLIWGEEDKDTPLYMGRIMEEKIRDSGLVVLKGAGHFSYLDKFREFSIIVDNFFGGNK